MTNTLLTQQDFTKFQTKDPDWFLDAVASTITDHCQWHIAPSLAITSYVAPVQGKGIVLLPSLYVTSVEELQISGTVIDPTAYTVHREGWVQFNGFLKPRRNLCATINFTSGYSATPKAVAEVGYELAATVLEKASGIVTELTRGPTQFKFKELGIVLSPAQEERLQPFRLRRI
jgi:hypothetical protein